MKLFIYLKASQKSKKNAYGQQIILSAPSTYRKYKYKYNKYNITVIDSRLN